MPPTETAVPPGKTLELLNPAEIIPRNVRQQVDAKMVDSIRRRGQETPVGVLRTPGGQMFLRFGDRRRLACIALGRPVEAVVTAATDEEAADLITSILDQLAENDDREPLTAADRAFAVQHLFELGADEKTIEKETGYSRAEITAARKARKSETARTLAAQYPLDMTQLSVIAEFDDEPEVAAKLARTAAGNPGQFAYQTEQARQARTDAALVAALAAELTAAGIAITDGKITDENLLMYWAGPDREQLNLETHRSCPGHVVYLYAWGISPRQVRQTGYCTDPQGNGHKKYRASADDGRSAEEATAERRRIRDGNDAWRAATTVREKWIREVLLQQKSVPAGAAALIARALAGAEHFLTNSISTMSGGSHPVARELLGVGKDTEHGRVTPLLDCLNGVSEQRAQIVTLALVLGAYEQQTGDLQTWRYPSRAPQEYLTVLASWGYPLSPIEQGVIEAGRG